MQFLCTSVLAEGDLNLFVWGNYTNPELIKKFEQTYDIEVTLTDYDANETALAKVRTGGHNFDLVVPTNDYLKIWINEGLLLETRPDKMENFHHVHPDFVNPESDPGRRYSVPWLWGSTGVMVDTSVYSGDINTSAIYLDPPEELIGKVNVPPEMNDVINSVIMYVGGEPCTTDKNILSKVRDRLLEAKPKWLAMDFGMIAGFAKGDVAASFYRNGAAYRARELNPSVRYGYPREGFILWSDSVAVLRDARNIENAKLFQNFIMLPENAAMISAFARYSNGIKGSEAFMPDDMKNAPEFRIPDEYVSAGRYLPTCSPDARNLYTQIWTELHN